MSWLVKAWAALRALLGVAADAGVKGPGGVVQKGRDAGLWDQGARPNLPGPGK